MGLSLFSFTSLDERESLGCPRHDMSHDPNICGSFLVILSGTIFEHRCRSSPLASPLLPLSLPPARPEFHTDSCIYRYTGSCDVCRTPFLWLQSSAPAVYIVCETLPLYDAARHATYAVHARTSTSTARVVTYACLGPRSATLRICKLSGVQLYLRTCQKRHPLSCLCSPHKKREG